MQVKKTSEDGSDQVITCPGMNIFWACLQKEIPEIMKKKAESTGSS